MREQAQCKSRILLAASQADPVALLTEKRMQVLSWYTALGPAVGSRCFSTLPLSPVSTDCSSFPS